MFAAARREGTTWARRAPAVVLALLALVGHLVQALHFAAHAHVYCPVHQRMEHAGAHDAPPTGGSCCGHEPGEEAPRDSGDDGDGEHEACGMQPPGKLADVPAPLLGALLGDAVAAPALPAPAQERHGLDPLILAPKHSPPA